MSGGLKVGIVATVILALSIVGVLAAEQFGDPNDDAVPARETGRDPAKPGNDAAAAKALELGTEAKISPNYRVAVAEVTRYEVPTGQLLAATIEATYIGKEDGEPWADFNVELFGAGSRTFGESDCPFALGDLDPSSQPTLETGDEARYIVCFDVPLTNIKAGKILVEEAFSTDDRTFWSTDDAVTKPLPAPPPRSSGQRAPATQPQGQPDNDDGGSDAEEQCEKYEDDVEDYKDNIDHFEKLAEQGDEDDQEEFEEWKDAMDANVEQYERTCG